MITVQISRLGVALLVVCMALTSCSRAPAGTYYASAPPSERARTAYIDNYMNFKWDEIGQKKEMWANYTR